MNSLAYLSRQYDVLASTPPSTPTGEFEFGDGGALQRGRDAGPSRAKRTRSWQRSMLAVSTNDLGTSSSKRSRSSPALAAAGPSKLKTPPPPLERTHDPRSATAAEQFAHWSLERWRRTWLIRTWILVWDALAHAYRQLVHTRIAAAPIPVQSTTESSSDEEDVLVTRARPRPPPKIPQRNVETDTEPPTPELPAIVLNVPTPERPVRGLTPQTLLPNPLANYLLSYTPPSSVPSTQPSTPPPGSTRRASHHQPKTLVLDLDETLIHSTSRPLHSGTGGSGLLGLGWGRRSKPPGHMVEVVLGGRSTLYHVYKRPFVDYFLRKVSGWYTLVVFTASMQEYADPVIDWLDGGRGILARRLFRESCTQLPSGSYSKDLSVVEPDLSRVCLLDNSPMSYSINQTNGIPIEGWTHDQNDEALLDLLPFLDSLRFASDVRRVLGIRGFQ